MLRKIYYIIISLFIALFILSAAIACPILFRGLYYSQIDSLNLVEETGFSEETIREAYDEMMYYCIKSGPNGDLVFSTGELKWSQSGKEHFDDVSKLFRLDLNVLKVSAMFLILVLAFEFFTEKGERTEEEQQLKQKRTPLFWGSAGLLGAIVVIGGFAAINFDRFFVTFHQVFFPGKVNWVFDPQYDEIIKILPEKVFSNFALVIGLVVIVLCTLCIALDYVVGRRTKK